MPARPGPGCGSRLCEPSSVDCAVVTGCVRASLFFSLSLSCFALHYGGCEIL